MSRFSFKSVLRVEEKDVEILTNYGISIGWDDYIETALWYEMEPSTVIQMLAEIGWPAFFWIENGITEVMLDNE